MRQVLLEPLGGHCEIVSWSPSRRKMSVFSPFRNVVTLYFIEMRSG